MMLKLKPKNKRRISRKRLSAAGMRRLSQNASLFAQLKLTVKRLSPSWQACIPLALVIVLAWGYAAVAQDAAPAQDKVAEELQNLKVGIDTLWVCIAAFLVFFMNAGFCMLETGFCRQKNAVNVLSKNLIVFALSTVAFWAIQILATHQPELLTKVQQYRQALATTVMEKQVKLEQLGYQKYISNL